MEQGAENGECRNPRKATQGLPLGLFTSERFRVFSLSVSYPTYLSRLNDYSAHLPQRDHRHAYVVRLRAGPESKTALERLLILSPTCILRVSSLQLGAMSIGQALGDLMGTMDKEQSFELLDAFVEAGGNFIDTASLDQLVPVNQQPVQE